MLNEKEKQEINRLARSLNQFIKRQPKPPTIRRISDADGDRIHVTDNGQEIDIAIVSNQTKSSSRVR